MRPNEVDVDRVRAVLSEDEFRGFCLGMATWNDFRVDSLLEKGASHEDLELKKHQEDAAWWVDFALHVGYPSMVDDPRVRRARRDDDEGR